VENLKLKRENEKLRRLAPTVGTAAACKALGIPHTTVYRWRKPQTKTAERKQRSSLRADLRCLIGLGGPDLGIVVVGLQHI
jgi:hypothetical protein